MTLTPTQLNRTTLLRQGLLRRSTITTAEAVRRFGPLQSQSAASTYLALWNRVSDFDPVRLDEAYRSASLVKASLLRLTLHTVHADDLAVYRSAMLPNLRGAGFGDRRFTSTGMTVERAEHLTEQLAEFLAEPRTRREIEAELTRLMGDNPAPGLWRALRFTAPWRHHHGDHPWSFSDPARFVVHDAETIDRVEATARVVRRYLEAFGPATRRDIGQFTILRLAAVDDALDRIDVVRLDGPSGQLFDLPDRPIADHMPTPARLLPMWDNTLLAYADRTRLIPEEYRRHVLRRNGDVLPCLLVDGHVAGVWRALEETIEIAAFADLAERTVDELEAEAMSLNGLLADRDPTVYRRHHHWWEQLPVESRITFSFA
ncbi:MAG: winged helix DNA-binding domain-containing protein [Actinomycetota bacterium]